MLSLFTAALTALKFVKQQQTFIVFVLLFPSQTQIIIIENSFFCFSVVCSVFSFLYSILFNFNFSYFLFRFGSFCFFFFYFSILFTVYFHSLNVTVRSCFYFAFTLHCRKKHFTKLFECIAIREQKKNLKCTENRYLVTVYE